MPQDRDAARLRIATAGLTQTAVERVARTSFRRMPITLVDRARAQLRRFFSEGPWTVEDDAGLSAAAFVIYCILFMIARIAHTVCYLNAIQPARTIAFTIGALTMLALMIHLFVAIVV